MTTLKEWAITTIPTLLLIIFLVLVVSNWQFHNGKIAQCEELDGIMVIDREGSEVCLNARTYKSMTKGPSIPRYNGSIL